MKKILFRIVAIVSAIALGYPVLWLVKKMGEGTLAILSVIGVIATGYIIFLTIRKQQVLSDLEKKDKEEW